MGKVTKSQSRTLFVSNLAEITTFEVLKEYFAKFGKIIDVVLHYHPNGTSRRFAFVSFESQEEFSKALGASHPTIEGAQIVVKKALPAIPRTKKIRQIKAETKHSFEEFPIFVYWAFELPALNSGQLQMLVSRYWSESLISRAIVLPALREENCSASGIVYFKKLEDADAAIRTRRLDISESSLGKYGLNFEHIENGMDLYRNRKESSRSTRKGQKKLSDNKSNSKSNGNTSPISPQHFASGVFIEPQGIHKPNPQNGPEVMSHMPEFDYGLYFRASSNPWEQFQSQFENAAIHAPPWMLPIRGVYTPPFANQEWISSPLQMPWGQNAPTSMISDMLCPYLIHCNPNSLPIMSYQSLPFLPFLQVHPVENFDDVLLEPIQTAIIEQNLDQPSQRSPLYEPKRRTKRKDAANKLASASHAPDAVPGTITDVVNSQDLPDQDFVMAVPQSTHHEDVFEGACLPEDTNEDPRSANSTPAKKYFSSSLKPDETDISASGCDEAEPSMPSAEEEIFDDKR